MIKAFILINTETNRTKQTADKIQRLEGILKVHEVLGPYDLVVELEATLLEEITEILRSKIRPIPGVRNTVTCVSMH